jgi:hypothetical protein
MVQVRSKHERFVPLGHVSKAKAEESVEVIRYAFEHGALAFRDLVGRQLDGLTIYITEK